MLAPDWEKVQKGVGRIMGMMVYTYPVRTQDVSNVMGTGKEPQAVTGVQCHDGSWVERLMHL